MKRFKTPLLYMAISLLAALGLAACGGSVSSDDAEAAIRDAFAGNFEEANEHICDTEQLNEEDMQFIDDVTLEEVTCQKNGDDAIHCNYTVIFEEIETEEETTFRIQDGKLCSSLGASLQPSVIDDAPPQPETREQPIPGSDTEEVAPEDELLTDEDEPSR